MEFIKLPVLGCTLGADELAARARDWSAIGGRALLGRHAETGRAVLRYRNEQGIAEELRRLIDLEGRCCAFLKFDLTADKTDLVLTVSGTGSEAFLAAEPSKIIT